MEITLKNLEELYGIMKVIKRSCIISTSFKILLPFHKKESYLNFKKPIRKILNFEIDVNLSMFCKQQIFVITRLLDSLQYSQMYRLK